MTRCDECGSMRIQECSRAWFDPNIEDDDQRALIDVDFEGDSQGQWCDTCGDHVMFSEFDPWTEAAEVTK